MFDNICTRKEKTRVFLFFQHYKMVLNISKSERTCGARELPKKKNIIIKKKTVTIEKKSERKLSRSKEKLSGSRWSSWIFGSGTEWRTADVNLTGNSMSRRCLFPINCQVGLVDSQFIWLLISHIQGTRQFIWLVISQKCSKSARHGRLWR